MRPIVQPTRVVMVSSAAWAHQIQSVMVTRLVFICAGTTGQGPDKYRVVSVLLVVFTLIFA